MYLDERLARQYQEDFTRKIEQRLLERKLTKLLQGNRPTMRQRMLLALGNFLIALSQKL